MLRSVAAVLLLATTAVPAWAEDAPKLPWERDFDKALAKARETEKPILVYVEDSI